MYAQLDSSAVIGVVQRIANLPRDASLFDPLLSASLEWMNVLPVAGPVSPVRPRIAFSTAALSSVTAYATAGLSSPAVSTTTGLQAAADLHMAQTLTALGNAGAAQFFTGRANQTDPGVARVLGTTTTAASPAVPAAAIAAAAPTVPTLTSAPAAIGAGPLGLANSMILARTSVTANRFNAAALTVTASPLIPIVTLPPAVTTGRNLGILVGGKVNLGVEQGTQNPVQLAGLVRLAWAALRQGDSRAAVTACAQSLAVQHRLGPSRFLPTVLSVLAELSERRLVQRSRKTGARLLAALKTATESNPHVGEVRGLGMMIGIEVVRDRESRDPMPEAVPVILQAGLDRGLIMLPGGMYGNVISLSPPFVTTDELFQYVTEKLPHCLTV